MLEYPIARIYADARVQPHLRRHQRDHEGDSSRARCRSPTMTEEIVVAGVGMIPFRKPGRQPGVSRDGRRRPCAWRWPTPASATTRCSRPTPATSTATRPRPARALRSRHDRHPDRQRQQQLLHRIDGAVPGAPGDRRPARSIARSRSASSRCGPARSAQCSPIAPSPFDRFDDVTDELVGEPRHPAGPALLRRRRAASTCSATARRSRPSRRSAPRRAATPTNNPLAIFRKVVTDRGGAGRRR